MMAAATIRRLNVGPEIRKIVGVSVEDTTHPADLHGNIIRATRFVGLAARLTAD